MFNVMMETELMAVNGGNFAVPYYSCWENYRDGKASGYTWTDNRRVAYCICTFYYDSNGGLVYWY